MSFDALLQYVAADAKSSCLAFLPELTLCVAIVLLLVVRIAGWRVRGDAYGIAMIGAVAAFLLALFDARAGSLFLPLVKDSAHAPRIGDELFTGMIVYDHFTQFWRILLAGFLVLFIKLTRLTGVPDEEDGPDVYTLVLGSTVGLMSMASANHVLMIFLAMELASVPTYILAGLNKGRRQASEAALKYAVYGAAASGVMIYGMSLLCGALGSLHLPTMAERLAAALGDPAMADRQTILVLGGIFFAIGMAFKLATFPFHFWTPDVFEGATAEIGAFLSVASKAGALALAMRVALAFAGASLLPAAPPATIAATTDGAGADATAGDVEESEAAGEKAATAPADKSGKPKIEYPASPPTTIRTPEASSALLKNLAPVREFLAALIGLMAALTMTFGNLAAYGQTNIKRLFAYSTIAHAGYLLMPIAAAVALVGRSADGVRLAVASLALYAMVYLFMNLTAFALTALLRNQTHREDLASFGGLMRVAPGAAACLTLVCFSLVGLPPLAGFFAKFAIFTATVAAEQWPLLVLAVLNTVVSLFYYLRVVKTAVLDPEPAERLPVSLPLMFSASGRYLLAVTAPIVLLPFAWDALVQAARWSASQSLP